MTASLSDSEHILRSWHEWELDGRERAIVLVVETDVEMQADAPGYDAMLIEEVQAAAVKRLNASAHAIDRMRIVPVRY